MKASSALLFSATVATAAVCSAFADTVTVTSSDLCRATLPPMTSLSTNAEFGCDWVTVGDTERSDCSQELAHLDDDGGLILIDDQGFQHHAAWAATRQVTIQDKWAVKFRYEPDKNHLPNIVPAGGWTFVMQSSGPTAYSSREKGKKNTAVLGAPDGSWGFLFHHYEGAVRWLQNNAVQTYTPFNWQYCKSTAHPDGFDIGMTSPIDFTIGCTSCVWTVTMRQAGKADVVFTHDFSDKLTDVGTRFTLGFTGGSSSWGDNTRPMMYQKFTGISGEIDCTSALCQPLPLAPTHWGLAGQATFDAEKGLLVEEKGGGTRKYAAVCQHALYRDVPFVLDFTWNVSAVANEGAQGLSFSLVPDKTPAVCSNGTGNYYYPGMQGSAGFSLRSYNNDGLTWHENGTLETYGARRTTLRYEGMRGIAHLVYDGAKTITVNYKNNTGADFTFSKKFESLPEKFYPAFYGSTSDWGSSLTAHVRDFDLRLPGNYTRELAAMTVSGEQAFELASWNGIGDNPSARLPSLTLENGASVTVGPGAAAHGGTLAAGDVLLRGNAAVTTTGESALAAGRFVYEQLASLVIKGSLLLSGTVDIVIDPAQIDDARRVHLLNLAEATVTGASGFRLVDANGTEIGRDVAKLVTDSSGVYLVPKAGILVLVK